MAKTPSRPRPQLLLPLAEAESRIQARIAEGKLIRAIPIFGPDILKEAQKLFRKWHSFNQQLLRSLVDTDELVRMYTPTVGGVSVGEPSFADEVQRLQIAVDDRVERLESIHDSLKLFPGPEDEGTRTTQSPLALGVVRVRRVCERFHVVARQMKRRHADRPPLEVGDEYDVQDLVHALLTIDFDDIRKEEWTPSYAGGSSRMDFLLKESGIVVEAKMTRKGLTTKNVGEQLKLDIVNYQAHPDCRTLVCFIYDPESRLANPSGLESDLSRTHGQLPVIVIVAPR